MRGAAVNLKKVALEMGGKSPNIVFDDADFETAVDNALTAAFTHSGQVCSAGCRAIVQDTIYDRFVAEVGRRADKIRLGHAAGGGTTPRPERCITAEHRAKVEGFVASAVTRGRGTIEYFKIYSLLSLDVSSISHPDNSVADATISIFSNSVFNIASFYIHTIYYDFINSYFQLYCLSIPYPLVVFPCGSKSNTNTFFPIAT